MFGDEKETTEQVKSFSDENEKETGKSKKKKKDGPKTEAMRVEKHVIKQNNEWYPILDDICFKSKNLYNYANYIQRHKLFDEGTTYKEFDLAAICYDADCYKDLPAQTAQQTIKILCKNWKSYAVAVNDWKKHPEKYSGRPRLPKYLNAETGRFITVFTNQQARILADGTIRFPARFTDKRLKTKEQGKLQQVRIIPRNKEYKIEVVYKVKLPEPLKDNGRYLGVDIGLNNLAAIVTNTGANPVLINGRVMKSINRAYSYNKSRVQSKSKKEEKSINTDYLASINRNRNNRIDSILHKASKKIIDLAVENECNTIVVGTNSKLGQSGVDEIVDIPYQGFINMILYKAESKGINVVLQDEEFTSGTSFLEDEPPTAEYYDISRRRSRGLFFTKEDIYINADVNAAYQIMKKAISNLEFSDELKYVALHPRKFNVK